MTTRKPNVKALKKKLDSVFSIWIRKRDNGECYTCRIKKPIEEMQAGHYVSRMYMATRFDERNVHCQCVGCNVFKHGDLPTYAIRLQAEYGVGILQELNRQRQKVKHFTIQELQSLIGKYKEEPLSTSESIVT